MNFCNDQIRLVHINSNIFGSCVGGNRIHQPEKYKASDPEIQRIKRPIVLKEANIILEIRL